MRIMTYDDSWIGGLENKEIDPIFINGEEELSEYFFKNKTKSYGMEFTLEGYLDTNMSAGCDNQANKFWITHIEKLNGKTFEK